ncbi:MORC family CW-type zinc finger protein 4 [Spatholobus suberectus]|nr:MORC family CW-type zinc finger protein 4 [Spatholobus suberectus]
MDPEAMRQCMSFGFSDKSKIAIGQYGNGFKTGTMRLGADVIVFSRHLNNMILTQSIGLLSYTFLMQTQHDRIVVPMVDYKFDSTGNLEILNDKEHFESNLSVLLRWSPYLSEAKLLEQAYMSILYLRIPESFRIILRGQVVKLHNIADELRYTEFILYRPHSGCSEEAITVTTIGFVKEAPEVNIHGFNVYHKNRLILPFWQVVNYSNSRGKGVVGILRADYLEPTHNKQDFEKSSLFQKLGLRLKQMTWDYWDNHCHLIGYCERRTGVPAASLNKRKTHGSIELHKMKRQAIEENFTVAGCDQNVLTTAFPTDQTVDREVIKLIQMNKKLLKQCLELEKAEKELNLKVTQLRSKIQKAQREYNRLLEVQSLELWEEKGGV